MFCGAEDHHAVISWLPTLTFSGLIEPEGAHKCNTVRCVSNIMFLNMWKPPFTSAQSIAKMSL